MTISDSDEISSIKAGLRAFQQVIENNNLEDEFDELYLQYLPEEVQNRREQWDKVCKEQKVKVSTEGN
jgi:hypothetical protein